MNRTVLARQAALPGAALVLCCLLVSACATSSPSSASGESLPSARAPSGQLNASASGAGTPARATNATALTPASQSIIYTASMTIRAANVAAAAQRAIGIVVAAGGYTADENAAGTNKTGRTVSLTLKVPVPAYQTVLAQLSSPAEGRQLTMQQHATDVTQEVANVSSLVTSEEDAIAALQGLLKRAGSVTGLLRVQEQISADESTLDSLQAQQRALDHETTYATVTMTLVSPRHAAPHKKPARHGFLAGLIAGWRALRHATVAVLTALGAILPFLAVVAVLGGLGYAGWRRLLRRRARPTPTG